MVFWLAMSYTKKTVWILGAGFSRSLGGPLLGDLLTERGELEFKSRFPNKKDTYLYHPYLSGLREHKYSNMPLWSDVEEFLEFVDLARVPGSAQDIVKTLLDSYGPNISVEDLRKRLLQSVAGDCSFASFKDPSLEAWEPYLDWHKTLNEKDTVITFNYDGVVERLGEHLKSKSLLTVLPWDKETQSRRPVLLKLHGSVDWCYGEQDTDPNNPQGGVTITSPKLAKCWADEEGKLPLIGIPGPNKAQFKKAHFDVLWELALHHIRQAEVIVFLGYRFPPSDAQSRKELLKAIRENSSPYLRVHIVLGPDINNPDTVRLQKMLETVLKGQERDLAYSDDEYTADDVTFRSYRVIRQPLLVQDFFTVMDLGMLDGWKNNVPSGTARLRHR